jgi:hypothetical protein
MAMMELVDFNEYVTDKMSGGESGGKKRRRRGGKKKSTEAAAPAAIITEDMVEGTGDIMKGDEEE